MREGAEEQMTGSVPGATLQLKGAVREEVGESSPPQACRGSHLRVRVG
jgi:hypothetical protein